MKKKQIKNTNNWRQDIKTKKGAEVNIKGKEEIEEKKQTEIVNKGKNENPKLFEKERVQDSMKS